MTVISLPEREPNERAETYEAFLYYVNLGVDRSLQKVADHYGKTVGNYEKLSAKWHWQARLKAHLEQRQRALEAHLLQEQIDLIVQEIADYKRELERFQRVREAAKLHERRIEQVIDDPATGERLQVVTVELAVRDHYDLTRWRGEISRFGRRAIGLPEMSTQTDVTSKGEAIGGAVVDGMKALFQAMGQREKAISDGGSG